MKNIPNIYKSNMIPKNNNMNECLLTNIEDNTIQSEIENIFSNSSHPFNKKVEIKTKDNTYITYLYSKTNTSLLTLDNIIIPINEIIYLRRI